LQCSYELLNKHKSNADFWTGLDIIGTAGVHIGFDGTGKEIALGKATYGYDTDQGYVNTRCISEFGWGDVDIKQSGEVVWENLDVDFFG
jgi:hypothetical protein